MDYTLIYYNPLQLSWEDRVCNLVEYILLISTLGPNRPIVWV